MSRAIVQALVHGFHPVAVDVLNQTTLPQVKMPNRDGFAADPRPDIKKK